MLSTVTDAHEHLIPKCLFVKPSQLIILTPKGMSWALCWDTMQGKHLHLQCQACCTDCGCTDTWRAGGITKWGQLVGREGIRRTKKESSSPRIVQMHEQRCTSWFHKSWWC